MEELCTGDIMSHDIVKKTSKGDKMSCDIKTGDISAGDKEPSHGYLSPALMSLVFFVA